MGGYGSGRHEYARTPTVEQCRHLDVDNIKEFTERPGARGPVWWGDRDDPAAWITVEAAGNRDLGDETRAGRLRLIYTITDGHTDESEDVEYEVPLEYTECPFGGIVRGFGVRGSSVATTATGARESCICRSDSVALTITSAESATTSGIGPRERRATR